MQSAFRLKHRRSLSSSNTPSPTVPAVPTTTTTPTTPTTTKGIIFHFYFHFVAIGGGFSAEQPKQTKEATIQGILIYFLFD